MKPVRLFASWALVVTLIACDAFETPIAPRSSFDGGGFARPDGAMGGTGGAGFGGSGGAGGFGGAGGLGGFGGFGGFGGMSTDAGDDDAGDEDAGGDSPSNGGFTVWCPGQSMPCMPVPAGSVCCRSDNTCGRRLFTSGPCF